MEHVEVQFYTEGGDKKVGLWPTSDSFVIRQISNENAVVFSLKSKNVQVEARNTCMFFRSSV